MPLRRARPDLWGAWVDDHPGLPGLFRVPSLFRVRPCFGSSLFRVLCFGSHVRHGSRPALVPAAEGSGGNSATTTIRPAPHRGQTRVGVTVVSGTVGMTGSGSDGASGR
jgi:hypothetical protein